MPRTSRKTGPAATILKAMLLAPWLAVPCCPAPAGAAQSVELAVGGITGEGWQAADARAVLDVSGPVPVLRVSLPAIRTADDRLLAGDVSLTCRGVEVNASYVVCPDGHGRMVLPPADAPLETTLDFVLRREDGHWRAGGRLALGGGVAWSAAGGQRGIEATLESSALPVASLDPWLPRLPGSVASLSGELGGLEATLRLRPDGTSRVQGSLRGRGLGFDTESGTVAAAGVIGDLDFQWESAGDGWRGRAELGVQGGELLVGSFYTSLSDAPLRASAALEASGTAWRVTALEVHDADALSLSGSALWDWEAEQTLQELDLELADLRFPGFYRDYLQPVLAQYGFGNLQTQGAMAGRVVVSEGGVERLELALNHVDLSDAEGRLQFTDLDGELRWRSGGEPQPSRVTWQGGRVYSIELGSADIQAEAVADNFRLTRQTLLPVLDGALVINAFQVSDWFGAQPELLFDAQLMPISLATLSGTLGWPEMQGTLAGRLPELTFRDGVYRLGGSLVVDVFDGTVLVENLRLERPFGVLPKLVADIRFNDLDLERLTGTFTIGRITGLLAGYVRNLRLLNWQPVHFDARLATPEDDRSERRISQRAVNTLSNLGGGGASGALSRTFLRIFDDFAYRKLGLECTLRGNVCEMGGVAPAPNGGYYIVQGGGLPRVDVIGYVRRVDWPVLVDQLVRAMQGETPSLQAPPDRDNSGS